MEILSIAIFLNITMAVIGFLVLINKYQFTTQMNNGHLLGLDDEWRVVIGSTRVCDSLEKIISNDITSISGVSRIMYTPISPETRNVLIVQIDNLCMFAISMGLVISFTLQLISLIIYYIS